MIAVLVLAGLASLPFVSSDVEKPGAGVSTSLDTNGKANAAASMTALDAERAFAADARTLGQWTAFRKWAASDATMFVPQPINAQAWLKDRKDPRQSIRWSPVASYVSCDDTMAANTGPWRRPDASVGYFSTIWQRQADKQWKWTTDAGDTLATARWALRSVPIVRRAACGSKLAPPPEIMFRCAPQASRKGASTDGTLAYFWYVACGGGSRSLRVWIWTGTAWDSVIDDSVVMALPK